MVHLAFYQDLLPKSPVTCLVSPCKNVTVLYYGRPNNANLSVGSLGDFELREQASELDYTACFVCLGLACLCALLCSLSVVLPTCRESTGGI